MLLGVSTVNMQSKFMSIVEVLVNIIVGFLISAILTHYMFNVSLMANIWITTVFTTASLIRGYMIRRIFNSVRNIC